MVPVGALLSHLPKFNGTNVLLEDWKERLERVAQLSIAKLALNTL